MDVLELVDWIDSEWLTERLIDSGWLLVDRLIGLTRDVLVIG